ncbi:hypothetical protein BCR36DRAFT_411297 [Piromyces finnis]|uniref:Uncharacterized protein n=1 Tax=Piromyces finnis TaxID=1754191 RepID=A0A1Y1VCL9_9FUNG|nr:hypothetical protein BCR36DRAFT_411297 [Piromyces finnis]|eukprot:ORX52935.1 hypothetical protein BCR36DRAFT_411297 [Piromyces finnis]
MVTILLISCLSVLFLLFIICIKFVYLPIRSKREKRRVTQDRNAFFQNGESPFVQVDVQRIQENQENQNIVEVNYQEEGEENIEISVNSTLNSPSTSYYQKVKPTVDIATLYSKSIVPIISNSNSIFKQTNVIIN